MTTQAVGNAALLVALLFGCVTCGWAAKRSDHARLGWALMALAWLMGAVGQVLYSVRAAAGDSLEPSPKLDTFAYLAYSVPVIAALFVFPKARVHAISSFRGILDAIVITVGLVFISEATILGPVRAARALGGLPVWSGLIYPVADLAICSLVFTLGMRQPSSRRNIWLCMGAGLVLLAVTDSIYVRLLAEGATNLTGSPLVLGWMAAPVLTALAALLPERSPLSRSRNLALLTQLMPYLPVLGAVLLLAIKPRSADPFLLSAGLLLLVAVTVRQVMIVYENVTLTRDLEAKVSARTSELATLGSIITSSSDAVVGISTDGAITAWNTAAEDLYGHRAAEVMGRQATFLSEAGRSHLHLLLQRAERGEPLEAYEIEWSRPDGSVVPVALRISPIENGGKFEGMSVFGQDISERRQAAAALEVAREEALESSRLKSEFLATMSHEIRTPMNGVIGLTTLLLGTGLTSIQRRYAEGVLGAGEALLSVINDILDFSKLEAGKVTLDPQTFDPRRLVEDIGALLAPAAASKHLELITYCLPGVPVAVKGDSGRVRQILLNLASNAVKFTLDGEVIVRIKPVAHSDDFVRLRFEVRDTGIGILAEDQGRLFQSFSQADATTTRRFGGTGLGLAISRRLVEVMGGTIGVESEPGKGSTFWFEVTLPVEAATGEPVRDGHILSDLRVLVVDDNATNREIVEAQLTGWRMRSDSAGSGSAALAQLRQAASGGAPYDLILLDMFMPEMDGLQLAQAISGDPEIAGTPMVMLTSSLQLEPDVLREAGIGEWLSKPLRASELYDKLLRLMSDVGPTIEQQPQPQLPTLTGRGRILVVEDNPVNQMVAEGLLARLGYEYFSVADGVEAIAAFKAGEFAAILMDCHMPVMDGYSATRAIRQHEAGTKRIPIVAMTAGALEEDRDRCLAAGMDDYISKPVSMEGLHSVLRSWTESADDSSIGGTTTAVPAPSRSMTVIDMSQIANLREIASPDNPSLLTAILQRFVEDSKVNFADLQQAFARGDCNRVAALAHKLKGSSGTVGAPQVASLSGELESAANQGCALVRPHLVEELDHELQRAREALVRIAAAGVPTPS